MSRLLSALRAAGLVVAWLSLVVTPCALALDVSHGCPHAAPADVQATHAHHGHADISEAPSCSSVETECCDSVVASIDSRGQQDTDDLQPDSPAVPCDYTDLAVAMPAAVAEMLPRPPDPPGASPPRHVLFCVYLK